MKGPDDDTTGARRSTQPKPGERDRACLIVIRGLNVGEMYKLTRSEMVVGRGHPVDVEILDDGISRKHARIDFKEDGTVHVVDLGSRNGTYVNGHKIEATQELRDGDKIQLSSVTILKF